MDYNQLKDLDKDLIEQNKKIEFMKRLNQPNSQARFALSKILYIGDDKVTYEAKDARTDVVVHVDVTPQMFEDLMKRMPKHVVDRYMNDYYTSQMNIAHDGHVIDAERDIKNIKQAWHNNDKTH